jgi:hypothetical protein
MRFPMIIASAGLYVTSAVLISAADVDVRPGSTVLVQGLVMIGLTPDALRIALPDADRHIAQLTMVGNNDKIRTVPLPKGRRC